MNLEGSLKTTDGANDPLIIVVDHERSILDVLQAAFEGMHVRVATEVDPKCGLELIIQKRPKIVFLGLNMPKLSGMVLLEKIVEFDAGIEVILLSDDYSPSSAVEAIQKGAANYITKPFAIEQIRALVAKTIEEIHVKRETSQMDAELASFFSLQGIIGRSPRMLGIFSMMRRIAPHFRTVLITGPSGTGKELVARALHAMCPVASKSFVVCNCPGIPETLAESEWFGYVKGAFTGAYQDKRGIFEHANGGSIFLDEIGETPLGLQAKLLRVLQSHEIQPVGTSVCRKLDLRIIAATNRDLKEEAREKRFRDDLFYRLSTVHIKLPALRERKEDLPLLMRHFVEKFAAEYRKPIGGITRRAQDLLTQFDWPGNVRELENLIGHAAIMTKGPVVDICDLPAELLNSRRTPEHPSVLSLAEVQRNHVHRVMEIVQGNKVRAAELLGISRSTLYQMLTHE